MDWLDPLAVQGTLKSLLQHHSSKASIIETCKISCIERVASPKKKASILWRSAFFIVQLSHPYMTTGKIIALSNPEGFSSVQFSHSIMSDSLWPHESQHAKPPCPSPTPRVHSDSCPSSRWCHPAISSSVVPFSSCPQCLPAPESFPMSQLFACGAQSTGVSALASFLPKKSQGWSPSEWTGWISLQSKGLSRVFSEGLDNSKM